MDSSFYPTGVGLSAHPNPETQFSIKRFGTLWSFATGTQVELTENKRVFNLGPSFSYTFAAAEPSKVTTWSIGAHIEKDSEKLFEDVENDKRNLGGSVSYHYGDTYSYKKGNSRDVSISGKEEAGGVTAYGIEKQSETMVSDGGLIQEKLQRCATQEDGTYVPFRMKTEGGSFHQTSMAAMTKSEALAVTGITRRSGFVPAFARSAPSGQPLPLWSPSPPISSPACSPPD